MSGNQFSLYILLHTHTDSDTASLKTFLVKEKRVQPSSEIRGYRNTNVHVKYKKQARFHRAGADGSVELLTLAVTECTKHVGVESRMVSI